MESEDCWAGAGEGVPGTFWVADEDDWTGAAGAEGVCATAGAGVEGVALLDEAADGFGW